MAAEDTDTDQAFYNRADAVISTANAQLGNAPAGKVSASTLYAASRFNAWVMACNYGSAQALADAKQETLDYFTKQYRAMLEENLEDYVKNFQQYIQPKNS